MEAKDFLNLIPSNSGNKKVVFRDKNNNPLDITLTLSILEHPDRVIIVVDGEIMDYFLDQEQYIKELIEENTSLSTALHEVSELMDSF